MKKYKPYHISFKNLSIFIIFLFVSLVYLCGSQCFGDDSLINRLLSLNENRRVSALQELDVIDKESKAVLIPSLVKALEDSDSIVSNASIEALVKIGPSVIPSLRKVLKSNKIGTITKADIVLSRLCPFSKDALPEIIQLLNSNKPILETIKALGQDANMVVPTLIRYFKNNSDSKADRAGTDIKEIIIILGNLGQSAKDSISLLIPIANNKKHVFRYFAITSLGQIGYGNQQALLILSKIAKGKDDSLLERKEAVTALGKIGSKAISTLSKILEQKDDERIIRSMAISALNNIDPLDKEAITSLIGILKECSFTGELKYYYSSLGTQSACVLQRVGPVAKEAVPYLIKLLLNCDSVTEEPRVAVALSQIIDEESIPMLVELCKTDSRKYILVLALMGSNGIPALTKIYNDTNNAENIFDILVNRIENIPNEVVPLIMKGLKHTDTRVKYYAGGVLRKMVSNTSEVSPEIQKVIPEIIDALKDKDTVENAAISLGKIGSVAKQSIIGLIMVFKTFPNDDTYGKRIYGSVYDALEKIGTPEKESIPELIKALKDENTTIRGLSAYELGLLGTVAKESVPALRDALKDNEDYVRKQADKALKNIEQQ